MNSTMRFLLAFAVALLAPIKSSGASTVFADAFAEITLFNTSGEYLPIDVWGQESGWSSSFVTSNNTSSSNTRTLNYYVRNKSLTSTINFSAFLNFFTDAGANIVPQEAGTYSYKATADIGSGGNKSSISASFICTTAEIISNYNYCGINNWDHANYFSGGPNFYNLAPGETYNFNILLSTSVSLQFIPEQRLSPVPLPPAGILLLIGILSLFIAKQRKWRHI